MKKTPKSSKLRILRPLTRLSQGLTGCGRIAAGNPLEAIEDRQRGELTSLLTTPGRYALQVGDDSMCDAGIFAGDIVVVQSQQQARNGDLVVALVDNEQVMLKRIRYCAANQIRLLADNPACSDLTLTSSRVEIQGKVIGQVRRYR